MMVQFCMLLAWCNVPKWFYDSAKVQCTCLDYPIDRYVYLDCQIDSFIHLICYEHGLAPFVHKQKYALVLSTSNTLKFRLRQHMYKYIQHGYQILVNKQNSTHLIVPQNTNFNWDSTGQSTSWYILVLLSSQCSSIQLQYGECSEFDGFHE